MPATRWPRGRRPGDRWAQAAASKGAGVEMQVADGTRWQHRQPCRDTEDRKSRPGSGVGSGHRGAARELLGDSRGTRLQTPPRSPAGSPQLRHEVVFTKSVQSIILKEKKVKKAIFCFFSVCFFWMAAWCHHAGLSRSSHHAKRSCSLGASRHGSGHASSSTEGPFAACTHVRCQQGTSPHISSATGACRAGSHSSRPHNNARGAQEQHSRLATLGKEASKTQGSTKPGRCSS